MEVNGTGIHLKKSDTGFHSLQQGTGGGVHKGKVFPRCGTNIDTLSRVGDSGGKIPALITLLKHAQPLQLNHLPVQAGTKDCFITGGQR